MKKMIPFLLILAILFAGCSTKPEAAEGEHRITAEAAPNQVTPPQPEKTTPEVIAPEYTPEEPQPTTPEVPEEPQQTSPETPKEVPIVEATTSQQTPPASKPQQTAPSSKPQSSSSGRKVSAATCKDTGSNEVWKNPRQSAVDYYEETDPERTAYLQLLKQYGNPFLFYFEEDVMRMYLGRTYGMPLYTGWELIFECSWASSDPTVAIVNQLGFVTPLQPGETVINVTYVDPQTQEATSRSCRVRVEKEPEYTLAELEQRAHQEAKSIAAYAMENGKSDLERIAIAAALVHAYVAEGHDGSQYAIVDGNLETVYVPGYNQPFGTLVTFYSTCAGSTRALGLVLEYMGFQWYHMGENQSAHQWCMVYDVDGQTAFADGSMLGMAGYGTWQGDGSNWRQYKNNELVEVSENNIRSVQAQAIMPK